MKGSYYFISISLNLLLMISFIVVETKIVTTYAQHPNNNGTETPATAATQTNVTETPATAATKKLNYCYNSQFGSLGTEDGQFNRPHDIVFDSKGYLYVNDRELNNFLKFSIDGKFISKFGGEGEDLGQFKSPYSMAIDSKDIIYVLDRGNDRIQKVTTDGKPLGALYSYDGEWLTNKDDIPPEPKPLKEKKFASPEAMAIDKDGNYYVTDTGHNRIIKFDKNFQYISHFGQEGSGKG